MYKLPTIDEFAYAVNCMELLYVLQYGESSSYPSDWIDSRAFTIARQDTCYDLYADYIQKPSPFLKY